MASNTIVLDVRTAGASGDMFLSALVSLIGERDSLLPVAASLLIFDPTLRVSFETKSEEGNTGYRLVVTRDESIRFSAPSMLEILSSVSEELELSQAARQIAERALNEILEAESRAHETPIEKLHLHETGSIDTILDIVGTAYLLERAGLLKDSNFISTHVAVGSGTINTQHGPLEVPVPAVAEILVANEVPFVMGDAKTEVLTPTGAAMLVSLTQEFVESSEGFIARQQGVGFGSRDLGEVPNFMRIMVGSFREDATPEITAAKESLIVPKEKSPKKESARDEKTPSKDKEDRSNMIDAWNADDVMVIETNVDDIDGEVMGTLFDTLLSEGLAYDVVMIPAYGKKNRPCYVIKVIAAKAGLKSIAEIMIRHLGTIGIRYTTWERLKAARETIVCKFEVDNKEYMVRVKVSRGLDGSIINIKPEADDVMKVSQETGIPVRELKPRIAMQAHAVTE
ncbi:MAG: nickel pincer cofactor biosynthesis protein LarC [Candidatus Thorarchaeota archaeon]|nr:nickel pincer cofactor biosynthesis protein LarC [Candidatus Thorarchaeota archaeon]